MRKKYSEILESMKNTYEEESGYSLDMMSDTGLRMKTVASELYALSCYGDYILRQGFVQTATGDFLDRHALLRKITRKPASIATGTLTFSLLNVMPYDVIVPSGTVCSDKKDPLVQYKTVDDAVIVTGNLSVTVAAQALDKGRAYNAVVGRVTAMVNPPMSINSVTNDVPFVGGCDIESDESLRQRIVDSYSYPKNGVDSDFLAEIISTIDNVLDCSVAGIGGGVLRVYVKSRDNTISDSLKKQIEEVAGIAILTGGQVDIVAATPKKFSLSALVNIDKAYDSESVKSQVENLLFTACSGEKTGKNISLSRLESILLSIDSVSVPELFSPDEKSGEIYCSNGEYLVLEAVNVYEKQ